MAEFISVHHRLLKTSKETNRAYMQNHSEDRQCGGVPPGSLPGQVNRLFIARE
jgi:hypothetical protein